MNHVFIFKRVAQAISLSVKIPRSANPLVNPDYLELQQKKEPFAAVPGTRWWMDDKGEVVKARAGRKPYQTFRYPNKPILILDMCLCVLCIRRYQIYQQLINDGVNDERTEQLRKKLEDHQITSIKKV